MQGNGSVIAGVVKSKDDLIIVDEYRVQKGFDQPLLTIDVWVVHSGELMQEENNVFFLKSKIFFQFGCGKCQSEIEYSKESVGEAIIFRMAESVSVPYGET